MHEQLGRGPSALLCARLVAHPCSSGPAPGELVLGLVWPGETLSWVPGYLHRFPFWLWEINPASGLLPPASRHWDPGLAVARNKSGLECVFLRILVFL